MKHSAGILPFLLLICLLGAMAVVVTHLTLQGREEFIITAICAGAGMILLFYRPEIGVCLLLAGFLFRYRRYSFIPQSGLFTPNNAIGFALVAIMIVRLRTEQSIRLLRDSGLLLAFLIMGYFVVTSRIIESNLAFAPNPGLDATEEMEKALVTRFAFLVFLVFYVRTYREIRFVLVFLSGILLYLAFSALPDLGQSGHAGFRAIAEVSSALSHNPNRFAFACDILIAWLWYFRRVVPYPALRVALLVAIPILAVISLATASRSGMVNLVLLGVLIAMQGRFSLKRQVGALVVGLVVIALAGQVLTRAHRERLGNIVPGESTADIGTRSTEGRMEILENGLKMLKADPFLGVGLGNFQWVHFEISQGASLKPSHNSYLWAAVEGGAIGLMLYLALYLVTFRNFVWVERYAVTWQLRTLATGFRISFLVFLSFSFFAEFWLNLLAYVLIGFSIILKRLAVAENSWLAGRYAVGAAQQPELVAHSS